MSLILNMKKILNSNDLYKDVYRTEHIILNIVLFINALAIVCFSARTVII